MPVQEIETKRNGVRYAVDFYYHENGVEKRFRKRLACSCLQQAAEIERRLRRAAQGGSDALDQEAAAVSAELAGGGPAPLLRVFSERWLGEYVAAQCRESSAETYRFHFDRYILPVIGWCRLDAVSEEDALRLKRSMLARGLRAQTINMTLCVLSSMLARACEWGIIREAPRIVRLRNPRAARGPEEHVWRPDQDRAIVAAAEQYPLPWGALLILMLRTGLRRGEALALKVGDIDFAASRLQVLRTALRNGRTGPPKGGPRTIDLSGQARSMLLELCRERRRRFGDAAPDRFIVESPAHRGEPYNVASLNRHVRRILDECGIPGTPHWARHTCASRLLNKTDIPITEVARQLGHRNLQTTLGYLHGTRRTNKEYLDQLDEYDDVEVLPDAADWEKLEES